MPGVTSFLFAETKKAPKADPISQPWGRGSTFRSKTFESLESHIIVFFQVNGSYKSKKLSCSDNVIILNLEIVSMLSI